MPTTEPARRIALTLLAAAMAAGGGLVMPRATLAAGPADAARAHLAATEGGAAADWVLVYERTATGIDGSATWVGKFVDPASGELHIVYRDSEGTLGGPELLRARNAAAVAALTEVQAKGDDPLVAAVAASPPEERLPIAVWLDADPAPAVAAVRSRHPELTWLGERPVVPDLATLRAVRAELDAARASVYASAQAAFASRVATLGGSVAYASTSAPLVFVDLPAGSVAALAGEPRVASLGLETTWAPAMNTSGRTVEADWTSGGGDQGSGVRVAVVEYHNVRTGGDLSGRVVASRSTTGSLAYAGGGTFDHPTWVAGAIAGQNATYRGVAPGALIVSSGTGGWNPSLSTDRAIVAAADWAIAASGGDADIVNTSLVQDTSTGAEEARRYFDAITYEAGRLAVSAAGNYANGIGWQVGSPGTGYNVVTVGGTDDRGTASRGDDRIWYVPGSNGSNFLDPPGAAWNSHGDFNKPNLSAPAVNVRTANGLTATGTSVATPMVAGIAAQLIARSPTLGAWPEPVRAILMASAVHRTPMPDGSINVDHEGAGSASALWANRIIGQADGTYGGMTFGTMVAGERPSVSMSVTAGQRVRVALSWSSHTAGSRLAKSDVLTADLDLRVVMPNGATAGSYTFDNANEWVEFTAPATGTARVEVLTDRFDAPSEPYGLAWVKIPPPALVTRLAATDRYGTSAAISSAAFGATGATVWVATGADFPDALAAGPAAAAGRAPILLVRRDSIPGPVAQELRRLAPARIMISGGSGAVSPAVESELYGYATQVTRVAGPDRYATAAAISAATYSAGVPIAFVATGVNFPDALPGGAAAGMLGGPLLLTRPASLPSETAAELTRVRPSQIIVLGGTGAISASVEAELRAFAPSVGRVAGDDRYHTAAAVAMAFYPASGEAWLATGIDYPDALAAAPAAAAGTDPLLLTRPTSLPASTADQLRRLGTRHVVVVGGSGAVSDGVISAVRATLDP
ncbi:MAG TPA: cell wall-binding repeat-containing protein [Candidatus Limnocylindria bacterium]|nr:cell wall-binding repeat-containing protein [Candidatus Limnocylindria bacterium]